MPTFHLKPGHLTLAALYRFWKSGGSLALDGGAWTAVEAAAETVAKIVASGKTAYGINTGFGILAKQRIDKDQTAELQRRLVLSHCAGVGDPLAASTVRLVMLLKIASLSRGASGVRRLVIERLIVLLNADALPVIPGQGSVGASGDLAPLAAMSAALIGEGEIALEGVRMEAKAALQKLGLEPLTLAAKEGLALLNGTQVSTALAMVGLFRAEEIVAAALVAGAMSVDAAMGSDTPFDPRIHLLRGHPGQIAAAEVTRRLLTGSIIRQSHLEGDERVQDPYCLRCQPQVMGAVLDILAQAAGTLEREANGVSDNPLIFADTGEVLSGGNFHAEPVAFAADTIALALAETGSMSERRITLLTDPNLSLLPAFLVANPGLNSGFMIAQVTAAALVSENKLLSHPASVDSIPTSANQEDHVSMATHGARRLGPMADNASRVVAIELLAAAQGIDMRQPLATSQVLKAVVAEGRKRVTFMKEDRLFSPDIEAFHNWIGEGSFLSVAWQRNWRL